MFIRIEWVVDATGAEVGTAAGVGKEAREKRELAYWSALGIGRIGSLGQLG
jgi:dynactin-4